MASDEQVIKDKERVLQTSTPFIRTSVQSAQGGQLDGSLFEIPTKKQDSTVNLDTSLLDQTSRNEETTSEHNSTNVTQLNAGFINSTSVCSESESIVQQPNETDRGYLDAIIEEEEDEQPAGIAASDTGDAAVKTETQTAETETHTPEIDTAGTNTDASNTETNTAKTNIDASDTAEIDTAETNIDASDTDTHTAAEADTCTATHAETDAADIENSMDTETSKTDTHSGIKSSTKAAKESNSRYIESKTQQPEKQRKRKRLTKAEQAALEALESFGGSDLGSVLLKNETFEERLARDKQALESESGKMEGVPPARKKTRLELAREEAKLAFENIPLGQTDKRTPPPAPPTIYKDVSERKLTRTQRAKLEVLQSFGGTGFDDLFPKKKEEEEEEEEEGEGKAKEGIFEEDKKENKPVSETGLTS
ncbi:PREDICTED: uncharacterized G-patch domain protein DDB_G0278987-like [Amphimedon queenslandica]|uniref:Uncharacterized protein n=1 Tax=Amphimedon queenslandica TaxID=400682 RepID=A0A1X7VE79_AMPQE|nr:PREDICTED: uncharacterized G-patch domain protein DDB_G0278987-like [Amphimedon queenslandica]|eukprot:XP_019849162.1 PREDICTED: uncharacterized G-patch domain protein DDB_G0278987-like [Amphimedon queenslandica]